MVDDKNWTNDSWWTNHDEKESNQTPNVGDASSNLYRISSQTQNPVQWIYVWTKKELSSTVIKIIKIPIDSLDLSRNSISTNGSLGEINIHRGIFRLSLTARRSPAASDWGRSRNLRRSRLRGSPKKAGRVHSRCESMATEKYEEIGEMGKSHRKWRRFQISPCFMTNRISDLGISTTWVCLKIGFPKKNGWCVSVHSYSPLKHINTVIFWETIFRQTYLDPTKSVLHTNQQANPY